jgi:hypothetical protein
LARSLLYKKTRQTRPTTKQKETAMKSILTNTAGILVMTAGSAFAGIGADVTENGWLWMLFLGFGALIVAFQLVPCVILGGAMLKGLFSKAAAESAVAADANGTTKS